ncbi:MAG: DUF4252 domain-containing protein [Bacteroidetes bacterium]|nr:DUF4252 domain-containing protein [Bacteroidota bacterium]
MKLILSLVMAVMLSLSASAGDGFDKLYTKYSATEGITSINLSESIIKIASKFLGDEDQEAKEVLNDIESIKLLTSEGTANAKLVSEAKGLLKSEGYEDLIRVNEGDEYVRIMVKESNEIIKDIIVYVESQDEFVFINITGDIDPEKVGKALQTLDIEIDGLNIE